MAGARIAVLVSGRGSNLRALLDASGEGRLGGRVVLVVSDVEGAPALDIARARQVSACHLAAGPGRTRLAGAFARAWLDTLAAHRAEVVVLAGFLRILGAEILAAYPDRVVNIHPSLLPAFPGLDAQRQALEYGVKVAGCTAHLVDPDVDAGPIIAQECVAVESSDSVETLAARILDAEHRILPGAVRLVAEGRVRRDGRRIQVGS